MTLVSRPNYTLKTRRFLKMTTKTYEVILPYFKQGDDLNCAIEETNSHAEAFLAHAEQLEVASVILRRLASCAKENNLTIESADTHNILVNCNDDVGSALVSDGMLVELEDMDDEELDDDDFYEDEFDDEDDDEE